MVGHRSAFCVHKTLSSPSDSAAYPSPAAVLARQGRTNSRERQAAKAEGPLGAGACPEDAGPTTQEGSEDRRRDDPPCCALCLR